MTALAGVRIVDLSAVVAGPLTTALLADQGAEVIKVERVEGGDIQRQVGSSRGGMSGNFHMLNRGKRSLALDITRPEGQEIVKRLMAGADALVQNYRPGVMERLGLGYEQLRPLNERLIYLSISGFGPAGPDSGRRAYDPIVQARSALAWVQGAQRGRPEQVNQLLIDKITAYTASQALTAALFARERTGRGQLLTVAMLDAAVAFLWPDAGSDQILQGEGIEHRPPIGAAGHLAAYRDGFATTMTLSDAEYAGLCRALELTDLAGDERFTTVTGRQRYRQEYRQALDRDVAPVAAELSLAEAAERYEREQVPFGRVNRIDELPHDPQVQANELFVERTHPVAGRLRETRPAPRFGETPAEPGAPAPRIGEHSREILAELGLSDGEIEALSAAGVVGVAEPATRSEPR